MGQTGSRILNTRSDTVTFTEQNRLFDSDDSGRIDQIRCPICKGRGKVPYMFGTCGYCEERRHTIIGCFKHHLWWRQGGRPKARSRGVAAYRVVRFLGVAGARLERPQTDPTSKGPCQEPPQLLQSRSREHGSRLGRPTPRAQADRQGRWPSDGARRSRTARRLSGSTSATLWRGCYVA
jgi:hypothetical protein